MTEDRAASGVEALLRGQIARLDQQIAQARDRLDALDLERARLTAALAAYRSVTTTHPTSSDARRADLNRVAATAVQEHGGQASQVEIARACVGAGLYRNLKAATASVDQLLARGTIDSIVLCDATPRKRRWRLASPDG